MRMTTASLARIPISGVWVDPVTEEEAVERVRSIVEGGECLQILTANPLMILAAEKDEDLKEAFRSAELVVADSVGVQWAARLQGRRLAKISGIDLMERLCAEAARRGWRVFFLGAAPGVAEDTARVLTARYSGFHVVGTHHGYFKPGVTTPKEGEEKSDFPSPLGRPLTELGAPGAPEALKRRQGEGSDKLTLSDKRDETISEDDVIRCIANTKPDLLFVALPTPFQDGWIHKNRTRLTAKAAMGVGGSFDVISGRLRRAPAWMRAAGLEWLFRLIQEPQRASRMRGLPIFLTRTLLTRPWKNR